MTIDNGCVADGDYLNYFSQEKYHNCPLSIVHCQLESTASQRCFFVATQVCKPGSVLTAIYLVLGLLIGSSRLLEAVGQTCCFSTALLRDRVYSVRALKAPNPCHHGPGGLLPHLFTLTGESRLHISVALVLRSPSAGVTRYPCPVEPGLSSSAAFRLASAAVRPGRGNIVLQQMPNVKYPCKFFWKTIYYK